MVMAKRYYWLKLMTDFFQDKHIKHLRTYSGGDTLVIVYLKMLLISVAQGGYIHLDGIYKSPAKEIALLIDEKDTDVELVLSYGLEWGIIKEFFNEGDIVPNYEMTEAVALIDGESLDAKRKRIDSSSNVKQLEPQSAKFRMKKMRAKNWCKKNIDCIEITDYENNQKYNGEYYITLKRDGGRCRICNSEIKVTICSTGYGEELEWITICSSCLMQNVTPMLQDVTTDTNSYVTSVTSYKDVTFPLHDVTVNPRNILETKRNDFKNNSPETMINTDFIDTVTKTENERNKGVTFPEDIDIDIDKRKRTSSSSSSSNARAREIEKLDSIYELYKDVMQLENPISKTEQKFIEEACNIFSIEWVENALIILRKRNPSKKSWGYVESILLTWAKKYNVDQEPWKEEAIKNEIHGDNTKIGIIPIGNEFESSTKRKRDRNKTTTQTANRIRVDWDNEPDHL